MRDAVITSERIAVVTGHGLPLNSQSEVVEVEARLRRCRDDV